MDGSWKRGGGDGWPRTPAAASGDCCGSGWTRSRHDRLLWHLHRGFGMTASSARPAPDAVGQTTLSGARTWWYLWRLARYRPGLYLMSGLFASVLYYSIP